MSAKEEQTTEFGKCKTKQSQSLQNHDPRPPGSRLGAGRSMQGVENTLLLQVGLEEYPRNNIDRRQLNKQY